ncbi:MULTISPECIES: DUF417 family protein [Neisseria]|uniref:DUF417 domain-containing protein n=1 Tax=Neisseria dumasiana TaxID=1931275 RepID=A0A1X3DEK9_9NEIS|nr:MULTISPECIES: DUF417 family protein [Neisseria]KPN73206.1 membrane protein [Neisseria sp. 74A18]OSI16258.1 hypothetical protein BV914_04155 [Neisseria dumasiana]OSI18256.1 hypothetical protein BV912_10085 [Neisseria dumasiana]OSI35691.1 hypothetical protein BV913_04600 [Neisseria dumasiana]UOO84979.1 YkgB family protein [Neisseria dumasiana]
MEKLIQTFRQSNFDIAALRAGVFLVFLVYGIFKWMQFEVDALEAMLPKTWLGFLYPLLGAHGASYLLGVVEAVAYISLFLGFFKPRLSIAGDVLVIVTGLVTLSLLLQIGFNGFVFKDVMLIGAGLVLLKHDLGKPA